MSQTPPGDMQNGPNNQQFPGQPPQGFNNPPQQPISKKEWKRQQREAAAVKKANRNWFARHKILTAIGALAILVILVSLLQQGNDSATPAAPSNAGAPTTTDPATATGSASAEASMSETSPAASETTPQEQPAVPALSNGDHIVGTDIQPGQYRAEVQDSIIPLCTVSQSEGENVLDIRNANEGSVIFTIKDKPGTVASFSGCNNIALAAESLRPNPEPVTNGDWLVGSEIPAGQYRGVVDTDSAIALGTAAQWSADGNVMDIRNANDGNVVFTVKESEGSVVSFSGFKEITKVG